MPMQCRLQSIGFARVEAPPLPRDQGGSRPPDKTRKALFGNFVRARNRPPLARRVAIRGNGLFRHRLLAAPTGVTSAGLWAELHRSLLEKPRADNVLEWKRNRPGTEHVRPVRRPRCLCGRPEGGESVNCSPSPFRARPRRRRNCRQR